MIELIQSWTFRLWLSGLRDRAAVDSINARLSNISLGNSGDVERVEDDVSEMRIIVGPGYRLYNIHEGTAVAVLLCGGDEDSQTRDIQQAKRLASIRRSGND